MNQTTANTATIRELDRLSELANIGAGHAADAFAQIVGERVSMRVPRVARWGSTETDHALDASWQTGVLFELEGPVRALVGILFRPAMRDTLLTRLLGGIDPDLSDEIRDSALMEVGNILASHVASAIADTLRVRLLPSIPSLETEGAAAAFEARCAGRSPTGIRIESELAGPDGQVGGLLVLAPEL